MERIDRAWGGMGCGARRKKHVRCARARGDTLAQSTGSMLEMVSGGRGSTRTSSLGEAFPPPVVVTFGSEQRRGRSEGMKLRRVEAGMGSVSRAIGGERWTASSLVQPTHSEASGSIPVPPSFQQTSMFDLTHRDTADD